MLQKQTAVAAADVKPVVPQANPPAAVDANGKKPKPECKYFRFDISPFFSEYKFFLGFIEGQLRLYCPNIEERRKTVKENTRHSRNELVVRKFVLAGN